MKTMMKSCVHCVALILALFQCVAEAFLTLGAIQVHSRITTRTMLAPNTNIDEVSTVLSRLANQVGLSSVTSESLQGQIESASQLVANSVQTYQDLPIELRGAATILPFVPFLTSLLPSGQQQMSQDAFPEQNLASYEMSNVRLPLELGDAAMVRPLLKNTQLEYRRLQTAYDANRHGYNARTFHNKVDGKGAAIVLCKVNGQWMGGYNPRGWASLGGSRPSVASFLFYKKWIGGWQKMRVLGRGGMACGNDLFDQGIYLGAEGLVIPLNDNPIDGSDGRSVASRLGTYFEAGPQGRSTLLPKAGANARLQELKVITGVYGAGEDIPNSGGVLDLGLY